MSKKIEKTARAASQPEVAVGVQPNTETNALQLAAIQRGQAAADEAGSIRRSHEQPAMEERLLTTPKRLLLARMLMPALPASEKQQTRLPASCMHIATGLQPPAIHRRHDTCNHQLRSPACPASCTSRALAASAPRCSFCSGARKEVSKKRMCSAIAVASHSSVACGVGTCRHEASPV